MSSAPKVSVIITTYNRSQRMKRAVFSVLAQTYSSFELHIVDDGSTDNTRDIVQVLLSSNANLHYWKHKKNKGLSAARNTGIAKSRGDYIAFLDDDDEWKPDSLGKRIALLEKLSEKEQEKLGLIYCGCEIHILHEKRITYNMPKIEGTIKKHIINYDLSTIPSSCLFPKKALQAIGGFDESLTSSIDHDIWMNLADHGYHAFAVKEPLVITYNTRKRMSMVTDTTPRIQGVEDFLKKWKSTFEKWHGKAKSDRFIQNYRCHVLGSLAGRKICEGSFKESGHLIKHILKLNKIINVNGIILTWLIFRCLIGRFIPVQLKILLKKGHYYKT
jgi:glycosyltransferase involved in cell wall biosynthesis